MRRLVLLVLLLVASGCVAPSSTVDPAAADATASADWPSRALPFGDGHDHFDLAAHQDVSTPNFRLLGHDPLVTERYGRGAGGYLCADANGGPDRRLAVVHSLGETEVAFVVADVTDPSAPRYLGELVLRGTTARDIAVTADTKRVLVATELVNTGSLGLPAAAPSFTASWRRACDGAELPLPLPEGVLAPSGLLLVSLEDPTAPRATDYFPLPVLGAHSVGVDRVDGLDIVNVAVTNAAQHASYFLFFTIDGEALSFESLYQHRPIAANTPALNLHNDGWIRKHPITGQVLAYLADWDAGLAIVDVTDLKAPRDIGRWSDYDATAGLDNSAAVHSAVPLDATWDGRHYTFIGQEILARPRDTPTGVVSVLDTTDPAAPVRVGAWTLPVDVEWSASLVFSTHYITRVDRTLFVTMYHGGVWAVDVTDVTAPRSVGVFLPTLAPPEEPVTKSYSWTPAVMEAKALDTGDVVVWDSSSGVYVVQFDAAAPIPAVEEWAFTWSP